MPTYFGDELKRMKDTNYQKLGGGLYLDQYSGNGFVARRRNVDHDGRGLGDIISTAFKFLGDNKDSIGALGNIATSAATVAKVIKDIKNDDEQLYEMKRIRQEKERKKGKDSEALSDREARTLSDAHKKIIADVRTRAIKSGSGIKIIY